MGLGNSHLARVLFVDRVELAAGTPENFAQHDRTIEPRLLYRFILRVFRRILVFEHS